MRTLTVDFTGPAGPRRIECHSTEESGQKADDRVAPGTIYLLQRR
jgi:hypothetical protein